MNKKCILCGKTFYRKLRMSFKIFENKKYCSRECYKSGPQNDKTKFQVGHKPFREQYGKKNSMWKGNNVGYSALHKWIRIKLKKIGICKICKQQKKTEIANISHSYKRNIYDWIELCPLCHRRYDLGKICLLGRVRK